MLDAHVALCGAAVRHGLVAATAMAILAGCAAGTSTGGPPPEAAPRPGEPAQPAPAAAATCAGAPEIRQAPSTSLFPVLLPIANADPSARHAETFRVPTRLAVRSSGGHTEVRLDSSTLETVNLEVGCHMLVGAEVRFGPAAAGTKTDSIELGGPDFTDRSPFVVPPAKDAPTGPTLYRAKVTLFETDIPTQHMWDPQRGRYRVLLQRSFEVELGRP